MTQRDVVALWVEGAEDAWDTAQQLMSVKKYHHAIFFAQLYLEKLLKAVHYHLKDDHPLYTHNLVLLSEKCGIPLTTEQMDQLEEITSFNVSARYPEHKRDIYNKATFDYSRQWLGIVEKLGNYFNTYLSQ